MVSKVAVIAIVAILAVPILLGYALNVDQVTETDYRTTGDPVNVTQLLENGTAYTYANADSYLLNTNFYNQFNQKTMPIYQMTNAKTSFPLGYAEYIGTHPSWGGTLEKWVYRYYENTYSGTGGYVVGNLVDPDNNIVSSINRLHSFYFSQESMKIQYTYYSNTTSDKLGYGSLDVPNLNYSFRLTDTGSYQSNGWAEYNYPDAYLHYADISKGYVLQIPPYTNNPAVGYDHYVYKIKFPDFAKYMIMTVDLDSITDANYEFGIGSQYKLVKTTNDGTVSWKVQPREAFDYEETELYYDQNSSNNTYQIKIWIDPNSGVPSSIPSAFVYTQHYEYRYVGQWPSLIGEANYYQSYDIQAELSMLQP